MRASGSCFKEPCNPDEGICFDRGVDFAHQSTAHMTIRPGSQLVALRHYLPSVLAIAVVSVMISGLNASPALYSDDWVQVIHGPLVNEPRIFDIFDNRPMRMAPFYFQYQLLGLNVQSYYWLLALSHLLIALALFTFLSLFDRFRRHHFALIVTLLFMVYPTDYSRMWLNHWHYSSAFLVFAIAALLFARFAHLGGWPKLLIAIVGLFASLLIYEGHLGLVLLLGLVLVFGARGPVPRKRVVLLSIVIVSATVGAWRIFGQQWFGIESYGLDRLVVDAETIVARVSLGLKITLVWGWSTTVSNLVPWLRGNNIGSILMLLLVIGGVWMTLRVASMIGPTHDKLGLAVDDRKEIAQFSLVALLGLVVLVAGYFPVVTVYQPNLSDTASRFNQFAVLGGAMVVGSGLLVARILVSSNRAIRHAFLFAAVGVLVAHGVVTQHLVSQEHHKSWVEQKAIWTQLSQIAPDLRDNTSVLLVLPGYVEQAGFQSFGRLPFAGEWDWQSGLRLLYDNPTLSGVISYPDIDIEPETTLTDYGPVSKDSGESFTWSQTVAFQWVQSSGKLQELQLLPLSGRVGVEAVKLCAGCVLTKPKEAPLRHILLGN